MMIVSNYRVLCLPNIIYPSESMKPTLTLKISWLPGIRCRGWGDVSQRVQNFNQMGGITSGDLFYHHDDNG
jgi:hypothetical protein